MEPLKTERPWGSFRQFTKNENTTVKILTINPDQELSLQYHQSRDEFWKVISGNPEIIIGKNTISAKEGDEFFIPKGELHRIRASETAVSILEIAFGDFKEDDIVRVEDRYGRV